MATDILSAHPYLTYEELTGVRFPASDLVKHVSTVDFRFALESTAMLSAIVANNGGPLSDEARRYSFFELAGYTTLNPRLAFVIDRLRALPPGRAIVHEEGLAYLAALIIAFSVDGGRRCSPAELTFLALAANDHLIGADPADDSLSEVEGLMADIVRNGRFNWIRDSATEFARASAMMRQHPKRGPWRTADSWAALQREAFGISLDEYLEGYLGPLLLFSQNWGRPSADKPLIAPQLKIATWLSESRVNPQYARTFIEALCVDRETMRARLLQSTRGDSLPTSFAPFYMSPLLRLEDGAAIVISPWLLKEQMRIGLWAQLRNAAGRSGPTQHWTSAFGDVFDMWAGKVALLAAEAGTFQGQLILASAPGAPEEFEDVVVLENETVVLFSAKASLVRGDVAKPGGPRKAVVDWYERFFFAEASPQSKEHAAAGAVRLLDVKIRKIRAGQSPFRRDVSIFPVIVTYDELSVSPIVYKWLDARCSTLNLLAQSDVGPLTVASVGEYESLMALVSRGQSLVQLLREKTSDAWRLAKLDLFLHDRASDDPSVLRPPFLHQEFTGFVDRLKARLFPRSSP